MLLLDTDITLYEDPYRYFKQSPFKDIVVINQEEAHTAANGGVLYVQVVSWNSIASPAYNTCVHLFMILASQACVHT